MSGWVEEWQGMVFAPGTRYRLSYDLVDTSLVPFAPGDQTAMAERVSGHDQVTVERVSRGPFSDQVEVTVLVGDGVSLATTRELFPTSMQVASELAGSATYELEKVRVLGVATFQEQEAAEANEQAVIESATTAGRTLEDAFDNFGKLTTLATIGLVALAVFKALDVVD